MQFEMHAGKWAQVSEPARSNAQIDAFYEEPLQAQLVPGRAPPARGCDVGLALLERHEFRSPRDVSCKWLCPQIVLPVKRGYLQLKGHLAKAMRNNPGLALDWIGNQRQDVGSPSLEAQLQLDILLRAAA